MKARKKSPNNYMLNTPGFLIKFVSQNYLDSTLDGSLHFNTVNSIVSLKEYHKSIAQSDPNEGRIVFPHRREIKITIDGISIPYNDWRSLGINFGKTSKTSFCSFSLLNGNNNRESDFESIGNNLFKIKEKVLDDLYKISLDENGNERQIILFGFINLLKKASNYNQKQKKSLLSVSPIEYIDFNNKEYLKSIPRYFNNTLSPLTKKESYYSGQREFRIFCTPLGNISPDCDINLGSFRKLSDTRVLKKFDDLRKLNFKFQQARSSFHFNNPIF